jgi:hypothetical protein
MPDDIDLRSDAGTHQHVAEPPMRFLALTYDGAGADDIEPALRLTRRALGGAGLSALAA